MAPGAPNRRLRRCAGAETDILWLSEASVYAEDGRPAKDGAAPLPFNHPAGSCAASAADVCLLTAHASIRYSPANLLCAGHAVRPRSKVFLPVRTFKLLRFNLVACLLLVCLTAGCKAQTNPQGPLDADLVRRVEVMVRSQYNLPSDYAVTVGTPQPGDIAGYNKLPITITHNGHSQVVNFLLSSDNSKLARLETFDLAKDPAFNLDIAGRPMRGNPEAKVTVVNFDDLECPFCARMHAELFPSTFNRYQNLVRFVYKDFPLTQIHPWAMHAAVNADCLAAQNGTVYWNYVDYLHAHGDEITGQNPNLKRSFDELDRLARDEGTVSKLNATQLDACIAKQDETNVRKSLAEADALGLQGAPALFVNGERIDGAVPEPQVWAVIDRALRAAGETPPPPPAPQPPSASTPSAPGQPAPAGPGK